MPHLKDGYAPIAKELLKAYYQTPMPDSSRRILLLLIHDIYGQVGRKEIEIKQQDIADRTEIDRRSIRRGLKWLLKANMILTKKRNNKPETATIYSINKHYKTWALRRDIAPHQQRTKLRHKPGQNCATSPDKIAPHTPLLLKKQSFKQEDKKPTLFKSGKSKSKYYNFNDRDYKKINITKDDLDKLIKYYYIHENHKYEMTRDILKGLLLGLNNHLHDHKKSNHYSTIQAWFRRAVEDGKIQKQSNPTTDTQKGFKTPQEAVQEFLRHNKTGNRLSLEQFFDIKEVPEWMRSGFEQLLAKYKQKSKPNPEQAENIKRVDKLLDKLTEG
jgi:transposase